MQRILESLGFTVSRGGAEMTRSRTGGVVEGQRSDSEALDVAADEEDGRTLPIGQGFAVDSRSRLAIERHAMELARRHYAGLGRVVETASTKSWDYEVDIDGVCWHVEVKGTTGDAGEVFLTPNEVAHARAYEHVALFIVSHIVVGAREDEELTTSGGKVAHFHPWHIDERALLPVSYRYLVPDSKP